LKNILFICRHNRFRSKIAESYFKKINKNKDIKISSSGVIAGDYPLDKLEVSIAKKFGINMTGKPRPTTTKLLQQQDIVVLVADDVPKALFNYDFIKNKIINWKITDEHHNNINHINSIIRQIMGKVEELNKNLENRNIKL
jgi:protein-tyrosine-phosphatase